MSDGPKLRAGRVIVLYAAVGVVIGLGGHLLGLPEAARLAILGFLFVALGPIVNRLGRSDRALWLFRRPRGQ